MIPTIIIDKGEVNRILKDHDKGKKTFPVLLGSINNNFTFDTNETKSVFDIETQKNIRINMLPLLESNNIEYIIKSVYLVDYIIRGEKITSKYAIKRMNIDEFITMYHKIGKRDIIQIFTSIKEAYKDSVNVEFILEGYNQMLIDTTSNCIHIPWKIVPLDKSKNGKPPKLDNFGNPIFMWMTTRRDVLRPKELEGLLAKIESLGIHVIKTFDANGVYNHFQDIIYLNDLTEIVEKKDARVSILQSMFPDITDIIGKKLINVYKSPINVFNAIVNAKNISDINVDMPENLYNEMVVSLKLNHDRI